MIKLISGSANPLLAQAIADELGIELTPVSTSRFADGELDVTVNQSCAGKEVFIIQTMAPYPNDNLVELMLLADAAKRQGAHSIHAVIPYLAYMRQDIEISNHAYSAPMMAQVLSHMFQSVILVEPHVPQMGGFFTIPAHEVKTSQLIAQHLNSRGLGHVTIVSPDAGGMKRAEAAKPNPDCPLAVIEKKRSANHDIAVGPLLGDVSGKDCVIVDDVLGTGDTLLKAAQLLKQNGAQSVRAYVTHLVMPNQPIDFEQSALDELIVFDTIYHETHPFEEISVQNEIAAIITRLIGEKQNVKRGETE